MLFTSIFCVGCLNFTQVQVNLSTEIDFHRTPIKDLMFLLLKQFSEDLHRWSLFIHACSIMKMAGFLGYPQYLLSSETSLGFEGIHNYTTHSKTYCVACDKKSLKCAICLNLVTSLGMFCKACGHGGHLLHQQQWFYRENTCPAGCGCSCLTKFPSNPEYLIYSKQATR